MRARTVRVASTARPGRTPTKPSENELTVLAPMKAAMCASPYHALTATTCPKRLPQRWRSERLNDDRWHCGRRIGRPGRETSSGSATGRRPAQPAAEKKEKPSRVEDSCRVRQNSGG